MRSKNRISSYIIFALLAVLVSFAGVALSKSVVVNPASNRLGIQSIYRDGWTERLSSIDLSKLPEGARKVHLVFDSWRPASARPAMLLVRLCGQQLAELQVTLEHSDFWVEIPENCQSGLLEMEVKNPFQAARGVLGIQFIEADFRYSLQSTVKLDEKVLFSSLILILILFSISRLKMPSLAEKAAASSILILAGISLPYMSWDNQFQLLFLSLGLLCLFIGAGLKDKDRVDNVFRNPLILLCIITAVGAAFRFYQLDFGFPERYHPDEPRKAGIALKMIETGDLDPNYFLHPSLLLYLTALLTKISYSLGLVTQLDTVSANFCGRMVSAIAGTLSVPLVFLVTRELLKNSKIAVVSSAIFAVCPLAITCSRYLKEDSLLLFFVLLTAYLAFLACNKDSLKLLLLSGLAAGFASGSKYSGMLAFAAIAATPWVKTRSLIPDFRQILWVAAAGLLVPVGFLITTPYALLNYNKFVSNFEAEKGHMLTGHHKVIISSWSQYWMYHFSRSFPAALSWPVLVACLIGIGAIIRNFRINFLVVLGLLLVFYLPAESVNAKPPPQPERYIFPCLPFAIIIASYLWYLVSRKSRLLGVIVLLLLTIAPLYRSFGLASELSPDTRVLMTEWITKNIPAGSKILIDAQPYSAFLPPDRYITKGIVSISDRRAISREQLRKDGYQYLLVTSPSYERYFLTRSADQVIKECFEDVFTNWELVKEVKADFGYYGFHNPILRLYKVD